VCWVLAVVVVVAIHQAGGRELLGMWTGGRLWWIRRRPP
jgi:hypothetical protein